MAKRRSSPPLRRKLERVALGVGAFLLLLYPADWAVWRLLMAAGHGMGTAEINETTAATLKGNHFEVYSEQRTTVNCSESLLPQAGAGACWWLRRHPDVVTQY